MCNVLLLKLMLYAFGFVLYKTSDLVVIKRSCTLLDYTRVFPLLCFVVASQLKVNDPFCEI
jgi:hypothetical protein